MNLPAERVGPWLRALSAALDAAAPGQEFVSLAAARTHLAALDPALSGELLLPAEVDPQSGMPALAWMTRASAAQRLAPPRQQASPEIAAREPALAARLVARARLHAHLEHAELLPALELRPRLRRLGDCTEATLVFDALGADGCWVRTRVELRNRLGTDLGLVRVQGASRVQLADGAVDLFARHLSTPLPLLRAALQSVVEGEVSSVSRGTIGPFFAPGGAWPDSAPPAVRRTLVLSLLSEELGEGVSGVRSDDPLQPAWTGLPHGVGAYRRRRLAVFRAGLPAVRDWLGDGVLLHPF